MGRKQCKPEPTIHMLGETGIELAGGMITGEVCRELGIAERGLPLLPDRGTARLRQSPILSICLTGRASYCGSGFQRILTVNPPISLQATPASSRPNTRLMLTLTLLIRHWPSTFTYSSS